MQIEHITRAKLTASEGMVLTNGEDYGRIIFLAVGEDASKWHEIPESEYEKILVEREKANIHTNPEEEVLEHEIPTVQ